LPNSFSLFFFQAPPEGCWWPLVQHELKVHLSTFLSLCNSCDSDDGCRNTQTTPPHDRTAQLNHKDIASAMIEPQRQRLRMIEPQMMTPPNDWTAKTMLPHDRTAKTMIEPQMTTSPNDRTAKMTPTNDWTANDNAYKWSNRKNNASAKRAISALATAHASP
jgi:hypothetical protein